ncbi:hypothetical protein IAU59_002258 [Kwoniella sp. CBS 9459]
MSYSAAAALPSSSSGSGSSSSGAGGHTSSRRRPPAPTNLYGIYSSSSSDEGSSCWSPPDTPTPINYAPLPRKARLQAGPQSSPSATSTFSRVQASLRQQQAQFAFSVPTVKRAPTSYLHYRGSTDALASDHTDVEDSDTDVDGEATETELGTALSDVESQINNPSEGFTADHEGDEVDMVLFEADTVKDHEMYSSPWGSGDRKGKRRVRMWDDEKMGMGSRSNSDDDGDDEMETEGLLRVKGKGKRPIKSARKSAPYPDEKMSASTGSVVGNICDRMGGLHASSTIIAMSVDTAMSSSGFSRDLKNPDLVAYHTASQKADISSRRQGPRARKALTTRKRVRGQHTKRCFQQLTASEDPLVNLPAFRDFRGVFTIRKSPASGASSMDISDAEDQALVDAEMSSTHPSDNLSDIDMKSMSSLDVATPSPRKSKVRATYEHCIPLAKSRLDAAAASDNARLVTVNKGVQRRPRPRRRAFPERAPSQASTSHLHRSSPSSLLPARRYMTRSHRPPIITHKYRSKPGRVEFTSTCVSGQSFLVALRARLANQRSRRQRVAGYNAETAQAGWRRMIGNWWGHDQVVTMVDKWWIAPVSAGPDEVEVEDILLAHVDQEDEIMLSPPASPASLNRSKKRSSGEVAREDRAIIGAEVQDRWARRNQLRLQELETYNATLRARREARKEQERKAAAEAIRIRLAQIAETRRIEEVNRREAALRAEEEERRRLERAERDEAVRVARLARAAREAEELHRRQEEAEAARLALISQTPPSPSPTESSTISDPPEYEFPFYPVVMPRSGASSQSRRLVSASAPVPVPRRIQDARRSFLELLPDYVPDRWTNRSPPPPPPYNATTDCQTLIAPVFIEDDEEENDDDTTMSDDDDREDEVELASPLVPARARQALRSSSSPEPGMVGAFPNRQLFAPIPVRHIQHPALVVDPIRAFEAALDLEEGGDGDGDGDDDEDAVEGAFDLDENDHVDSAMEQDSRSGSGAVAGVFQRVFDLVWRSGSGPRR